MPGTCASLLLSFVSKLDLNSVLLFDLCLHAGFLHLLSFGLQGIWYENRYEHHEIDESIFTGAGRTNLDGQDNDLNGHQGQEEQSRSNGAVPGRKPVEPGVYSVVRWRRAWG